MALTTSLPINRSWRILACSQLHTTGTVANKDQQPCNTSLQVSQTEKPRTIWKVQSRKICPVLQGGYNCAHPRTGSCYREKDSLFTSRLRCEMCHETGWIEKWSLWSKCSTEPWESHAGATAGETSLYGISCYLRWRYQLNWLGVTSPPSSSGYNRSREGRGGSE